MSLCPQYCYFAGGLVLCVAYCTDIEAWSPGLNWLRLKVSIDAFVFFFWAVLLDQSTVRMHESSRRWWGCLAMHAQRPSHTCAMPRSLPSPES